MDVSAGTTSAASTVTDSFSIIMLLLLWLVSPFGFVTTKKWVGKWWNRLLPRWLFVIWALLRHNSETTSVGHWRTCEYKKVIALWAFSLTCLVWENALFAWLRHHISIGNKRMYRNDELLYEYLSSSFCTVSFLVDLARLLGNKRSLNYTMWYIAPARRNYTTFSSGSWPMLLDQEEVALRSKKHQASSSCLLLLVLHNGSCSCISDCKQAFIYYLIYYPTRIISYFIPKEIQRQWEMEESNMKDGGRCAVVWYASVSFYVLTSAETFLKYRNTKVTTAPRTRGNWGNNQHGWITNFPSKKETFNPAWSHTNNLSEHCNYTYYCSRKRSTFLDKFLLIVSVCDSMQWP